MASCTSRSWPRFNGSENVSPTDNRGTTVLKPFQQTHIGRLPPELREQIYIELLATPPSYAGHDFAAISPRPGGSSSAPRRFVHIKTSWCQIMRTCRQIYVESRRIFFASKFYYFETPQEAARLIDYLNIFTRPILRLDTITAICLKNFVDTLPSYSKEDIDDLMSDPNLSRFYTRQELENQTYKIANISIFHNTSGLKNLRTVSLCFPVGEELLYIDILYNLTALRRGLIEFIDASHWLIRPQNPEDTWNTQYASFTFGDWGRGKDNEEIPYETMQNGLATTEIDSRAPELKEGDERYIEVEIRWPVVGVPALEPRGSDEIDMDWGDVSNINDVDSHDRDSHEALLEVSQDPAADDALTERSEHDEKPAGLGSSSTGTNQSLFFGLDNENSRDPQRATDTDEDIHALSQPLSEDVPSVQAGIRSELLAKDPSMSTSSALIAHDAPTATEDGRLSLLDTGEEDDQIEKLSGTSSQMPHAQGMQHWWYNNTAFAESIAATDQVQKGPRGRVKGQNRRSKAKVLLNLSSRPLSDMSNMRCPYTDEEMESYEKWQGQSTLGNKEKAVELAHPQDKTSSPLEHLHGHPETSAFMQNNAADSQEEHSAAASQDSPGVLVTIYPAGVLLLLFLIYAINTYHSERRSNVSRVSAGSENQY